LRDEGCGGSFAAIMSVAGIDLGGTKLAAAAFSDEGEILFRETVQLSGREGGEVGELIAAAMTRLIADHDCKATGVCIPGLYRSSKGTVWAPNIPGWDDYPLLDELRNAAPSSHKVTIDSDRAAYILGETWKGSAQGARDAIFIAVGTGIGAGILSGGRIINGHGDVAGAIGWLALDRPFAPRFVQHGCFEDQASGPGLVRVARDFMAQDSAYSGALLRGEEITAADIFAAHDAGDPIAIKVIDNAIELWGMTVANLVSLLNPEMIVFGGGIFGPAAKFLDRIRIEARRWAQPIAIEQVHLTASTLGSDAGLYGAGRLALTIDQGS
jgi:glucokinase